MAWTSACTPSGLASLLLCLQCVWVPVSGGKLLVVPVDGSHWLSLRLVVEQLHARGHQVVVVFPENNLVIHKCPELYTSRTFTTRHSREEVAELYRSLVQMAFIDGSLYHRLSEHLRHIRKLTGFFVSTCQGLLGDRQLLRDLADSGFDALLTDPFSPCGPIVAEYLSLPSVFLLRGIPCGLDYEAAQCPRPLSYVPRQFTGNTDRMGFWQRVGNALGLLTEQYLCGVFFSPFEAMAAELLGRRVTVKELLSRGAVWLLRFDFVFEFPRPLMPNMILIGGVNCRERTALPQELEEFVNSSGEYGVVILSMGSMVSNMPTETADRIAEALGQIPQKVLWRHTGAKPSTLAPNTKLMKWIPQNELLGHPKTRAFISHGGMHGIYEAICAGVPMVMIPLFADQLENVLRIMNHDAGVLINLKEMSSQDLVNALNTVINDTRYKENMMRLSSLHKDRPVEPLDLAVHWVEFVMKHKGAEHLRPAAHELNWIQYHSLDVIGFLLGIVLLFFYLMIKCCTVCYRCLDRTNKQKKNKSD